MSAPVDVRCVRCGGLPRVLFVFFRRENGASRPVGMCGECVARAAAELGEDSPELQALVNRYRLTAPGVRR